jgi:hypothetical protein
MNDHNFCLGGLFGIIEGGVAGIVNVSRTTGKRGGNSEFEVSCRSNRSGFAVKGIADAPNSSTTTNP